MEDNQSDVYWIPIEEKQDFINWCEHCETHEDVDAFKYEHYKVYWAFMPDYREPVE